MNVLGSGRQKEQQLGLGVERLRPRNQHQLANLLGEGRAPGLAGEKRRDAPRIEQGLDPLGLGRLPRPLDPLQCQEEAAPAGPSLAVGQALRRAARFSPLRGAATRLGFSAFVARAPFEPYLAMKSSTIWRATSSGYWMGGDFLK